MAALCNSAGHYIFALRFLSSFFFFFLLSFFPRLISAAAVWMSTILPHMVWTWCELRMQVWNVLHAVRWKYRTQKSPIWHHRTTLSGYIFGIKAYIDNRKNLLNSNISYACPDNMVKFDLLTTDTVGEFGAPLQISTGFASWQRYCTAL